MDRLDIELLMLAISNICVIIMIFLLNKSFNSFVSIVINIIKKSVESERKDK